MTSVEIIRKLKGLSDPADKTGMARFGINPERALGIRIPVLRRMAKQVGRDHALAAQLWASGIHEVRILAAMVEEPEKVSERQMESWIKEFNSWDICDQVCMNLFDRLPIAWKKAVEWSRRSGEFEKRAGFALMACLAWHDKEAPDAKFHPFFKRISAAAGDERNFVKKAVNWALRQIGKRNLKLNKMAVITAKRIQHDAVGAPHCGRPRAQRARLWIAADALRELTGGAVQKRLKTND